MSKRFTILLSLFALGALLVRPALAIRWNPADFEGATNTTTLPISSTAASLSPNLMQKTRQETGYRAEVEHLWGERDGLSDDNGLHRLGSARCYMQNAAPTTLNDSHASAAGIADYDNSVGSSFSGTGTLSDDATNSAATAQDKVGTGRCWIDLDGADNIAGNDDDNTLNVYEGTTPGWVIARAGLSGASDFFGDFVATGSHNLLYDSMFDTGVGTSPPFTWALTNATVSYAATSGPSPGANQEMEVLSTAPSGDVHTSTTLQGNTTYRVLASVKQAGAFTCSISTTGVALGGVNLSVVSATGPFGYTTLDGTFTTGTTAHVDAVALNLVSPTSGSTCVWGAVHMYEVDGDPPPQAGVVVYEDTSTATDDCDATFGGTCTSVVSVAITPPGPGYIAQFNAEVFVLFNDDDACAMRLWDGATAIRTTGIANEGNGGDDDLVAPLQISYTSTTPLVAGSSTTYQLDLRETEGGGAGSCVLQPDIRLQGTVGPIEATTHSLQVILLPTN